MKLEGNVAPVTGSTQGIGQTIAIRLDQEGTDIVIDYRSHPEGAEETKAIEATGRKGLVIKADLGIVSDVSQMIESGIQHFGKLDILVNNAGLEKNASFWEVTEADYGSWNYQEQ
jgi:glucose 1-dehydrogenase